MKTRYSKTTGTFYPLDIEYSQLPIDIQEVAIEDFHAAMSRPPGTGFRFVDGALDIFELPVDPPTLAQLNAPILAEIAAEEAKQWRVVREALLLLLPAGVEKDRLKAIDDKIVLARGKLKK
jgi:hypothetical protein